MVFTVNQTPRLQIGDAKLGSITDQIALIWQTKGRSSGDSFVVEYRPANSNGSWQTADTPTTLDTGTEGRINHSTTITGLDYSAEYEYRVQHFRNGSLVNTYQNEFETRLAAGDKTPFVFTAYGDSAYIKGNSGFREVQGQINQVDPDFNILLGDNAYNSGTHLEFDARFTNQYSPEAVEWTSGHIDYATIGNHEERTNNGTPHVDNFVLPEFDNVAEQEKTYSFDYGNVHFVTFNSDDVPGVGEHTSAAKLEQNLRFLEEDLKASTADWKIIFAHHPIGGAPDKGQGPGDKYFKEILDLANRNGVDMLLTGHSHTYSHTYPLTGVSGNRATFVRDTDGEYAKGAGVVQVISGMGGKSKRDGGYSSFPFVASGFSQSTNPRSENGFSKISVTEDRLTVEYIAADNGEVLNSFSIYDDPNAPVDPPVDPPSNTKQLFFHQGVNDYTDTVDTFLQEGSPNANNSNVPSLNVDARDNGGEVHGLLRFNDIFGDQAGQISSNFEIVSAQLELGVADPGSSLELYRMIQDWNDTDTWNSLVNGIQANGTEAASTADAVTGSVDTGLLSIDVTESIKAWQTNPSSNKGWAILPTGSNGVDFDSAEGSAAPRLVVEYIEPQGTELKWEAQGLTDETAIANGTEFDLGGGLKATVEWSTPKIIGKFEPAGGDNFVSYEAGTRGGDTGYLNMSFDNDAYDPNELISLSIKFSEPVAGLNFSVTDVDQGQFFDDAVEIFADNVNILESSNASYTLGGNNVKLDNETYMLGFEGKGSASNSSTSANIDVSLGSDPVSSITVNYFSTNDRTYDPNSQSIGIGDLTWDAK